MAATNTVLAIDQGTTSSRAIVFDTAGSILSKSQREFRQIYPANGWVEHDAEEIWQVTLAVCRETLARHGAPVAAIGITNQRETVVLWERSTGKALHQAIVWQDRRTADHCARLRQAGHEPLVREKTGLLLDPYFSGTKLAWLLDQVPDARHRAARGELAFGTIDSFLLWRLTGGKQHATDATNASRTLLFNMRTQEWDDELLKLFDIPRSLLPEVKDCAADYGVTDPELFGTAIPVGGVAGDQQAALIGQACFRPGMIKSTYGTGCFVILNTGEEVVESDHRLLTTVAYRLGGNVSYAVEGSIFIAGAAVQWLRDGLQVIAAAPDTETFARELPSNKGVYLVPAFTGLGAPYWDPEARGAIFGLNRDTGPAELSRAALESVCYQTHDLLAAMEADGAAKPTALRVDGGMVTNDWLLQCLADVLGLAVERPAVVETTALGAAFLAGLQVGLFDSLDDLADRWKCQTRCDPQWGTAERNLRLADWHRAVAATRSFASVPAASDVV